MQSTGHTSTQDASLTPTQGCVITYVMETNSSLPEKPENERTLTVRVSPGPQASAIRRHATRICTITRMALCHSLYRLQRAIATIDQRDSRQYAPLPPPQPLSLPRRP